MGILYAVTPLIADEDFVTWMRQFGNELPEATPSRYPTVREIRDTLAQLDGYSFEASTGGMNWEAVIFESGRQDDRWAGEWADLIVTEYHGDDAIPLSFYFSKGPARLPVLIVQQLTERCGPLVIMLDSCAIPLLITPDTDIDRAIQAWEMGDVTSVSHEEKERRPMTERASEPVLIVGAGPAGLATAACLKRRKIPARIFEAGDAPATTWRRLYDRLHLHTVRALSGLPGYPMPRRFPRYPSREQVVEYLDSYARHFGLVIETGMPVQRAAPEGDGWRIETPSGAQTGQALVSATGIFSNPLRARYPGEESFQGKIEHSAGYRNATPFVGQRVLLVGVGNSGAEIAVDLAEHGAHPTISIRAGANVVPRELVGVPIQRWAHLIVRLPPGVTQRVLAPVMLRQAVRRQTQAGVPRPTVGILEKPGVPVIGLELLQQARAGAIAIRPAVERFTERGVHFVDGREEPFDAVLIATGYRPALGYLSDVLPLDDAGFPRMDGVRSLDLPNLYFVGMYNNIRGTLFNIAHEAPQVAEMLAV